MRFLLDQSANAKLIPFLREQGHDLTRIARDYPGGLPDHEVLSNAYRENRILITHDRDFGRLVFVELQPHAGVILFRLGENPPLESVITRLRDALAEHLEELDRFIVVTRNSMRVR